MLKKAIPYIRSLGIKREDLVLCLPDGNINVALYIMDQHGYSNFMFAGLEDDQKIEAIRKQGIQYLVIYEDYAKNWEWITPLLDQKIGEFENVVVYKIL